MSGGSERGRAWGAGRELVEEGSIAVGPEGDVVRVGIFSMPDARGESLAEIALDPQEAMGLSRAVRDASLEAFGDDGLYGVSHLAGVLRSVADRGGRLSVDERAALREAAEELVGRGGGGGDGA